MWQGMYPAQLVALDMETEHLVYCLRRAERGEEGRGGGRRGRKEGEKGGGRGRKEWDRRNGGQEGRREEGREGGGEEGRGQ